MTLRCLTVDDWPEAEELYWELTRSGAVAGVDSFEAILAHAGTSVFGKFHQGRLVAMTTLHVLPNMTYGGRPYGLVENVVAKSKLRGQGHGKAVMQHCVAQAREAGCYKVMLLTGQARNARGFYEAVGFDADEKWGMMIRF